MISCQKVQGGPLSTIINGAHLITFVGAHVVVGYPKNNGLPEFTRRWVAVETETCLLALNLPKEIGGRIYYFNLQGCNYNGKKTTQFNDVGGWSFKNHEKLT